MIFISAGHHNNDSGAIGYKGIKEADLTKELRSMIIQELVLRNAPYIKDADSETLSQYLQRIKPGSGSVLCEVHFNSSANLATGCEVIVKNGASQYEIGLANAICKAIAKDCGLHNRGVKNEAQSHMGRLAVLHDGAGISVLPEICFINNPDDMCKYHAGKVKLAASIASLLIEYDAKFV